MPAPAISTSGEVTAAEATAASPGLGCLQVGKGAFRRACRAGRQRRIEAIERRAIRADQLGVAAHVEKYMGVVERWCLADAHEFPGPDLDHGNAGVVVEMGNDHLGHWSASSCRDGRTIAHGREEV